MNPAGEVTGYGSGHAFIRSAAGEFTRIDVPGTIATFPRAINDQGAVTGVYWDPGAQIHGFVRSRNGAFTVIDYPGASRTVPAGMTPAGAIAGTYWDGTGTVSHSFLWAPR
jgi:hypothetical protein